VPPADIVRNFEHYGQETFYFLPPASRQEPDHKSVPQAAGHVYGRDMVQ
jgi:hypothetical protein